MYHHEISEHFERPYQICPRSSRRPVNYLQIFSYGNILLKRIVFYTLLALNEFSSDTFPGEFSDIASSADFLELGTRSLHRCVLAIFLKFFVPAL